MVRLYKAIGDLGVWVRLAGRDLGERLIDIELKYLRRRNRPG